MTRFLQETRLDYVWIPGKAPNELGVQEADISGTFSVPFLYNTQTPLLITPGFTLQMWNGPVTDPPGVNPLCPPFPARTYDAYLDASWNPQPTPVLGAELGFRVGIYSDFNKVVEESLRYQGHGLAVISLSPSFQVKAGVMYLDRNHVKLLPTGGLIWTPNPDLRFEILFPNPRIAKRLWTHGNTDWWIYARGEYGGNSWTLRIAEPPDPPETIQVDYNDLRAGIGLEFDTPRSWKGLFEVGATFEREIYVRHEGVVFRPDPTVYVRGGVAF